MWTGKVSISFINPGKALLKVMINSGFYEWLPFISYAI